MSANMATTTGIVVHISGAITEHLAWFADASPPMSASIVQDIAVKFDNRQNLRTGIALLRTLLRKAGAAIRTVASKGSPIVDASVASGARLTAVNASANPCLLITRKSSVARAESHGILHLLAHGAFQKHCRRRARLAMLRSAASVVKPRASPAPFTCKDTESLFLNANIALVHILLEVHF